MITIGIPYHNTSRTAFFLQRLMKSIDQQTYKDYEIVLAGDGDMGENHNAVITRAKGDIIKMMQMDDYFAHFDALQNIVNDFTDDTNWLISANLHDDGTVVGYPHIPEWNDKIYTGRNTLGSVSTLTLRKDTLLFNDELRWMIDVDMYWRLFQNYGLPKLCMDPGVVVQWHEGQQTNLLTEEEKEKEYQLMMQKYGK